jgi:glutamate racemase
MIEPAVDAALRETNNKKIGIIGQSALLQSNAYLNAIKSKLATMIFRFLLKHVHYLSL